MNNEQGKQHQLQGKVDNDVHVADVRLADVHVACLALDALASLDASMYCKHVPLMQACIASIYCNHATEACN